MFDLRDKVALIAGGGSGIGAATAQLMGKLGAKVIVGDIELEAAEYVAHDIEEAGGEAISAYFDLHDENSISEMILRGAGHFGHLDILHANAADLTPMLNAQDGLIADMDTAVWETIFHANCTGTMLCSKYAIPHLLKIGGGAIINTGSALSMRGNLAQSAYSAGKAAILQLTRTIATQYGKQWVRCNAVLPGFTRSPLIKRPTSQAVADNMLEESLLPEIVAPTDIANVVAFLASDAARMITGQAIVVDGGESIHAPGLAKLRDLRP